MENIEDEETPVEEWTLNQNQHFKMAPDVRIWLGSLNVRGVRAAPKRMIIDAWANANQVALLGLQETKNSSNSSIFTDNYLWFSAHLSRTRHVPKFTT